MKQTIQPFSVAILRRVRAAHLAAFALTLIWAAAVIAADQSAPVYPEHQDLSYYLDASGRKQPIRTKADWEIRRQHVLGHMQTVMGPLPKPEHPVPLEIEVKEEVKVGPLLRRLITYHTDSPSRRTAAYLFLPPTSNGKKQPAVLCLHQTTDIGKKEPAGLGGRTTLRYALELAQRGYVTLAPDYPSFGDSDFDFDPKHGYISGTMKAIYDNIRAVDLLVSLKEVDAERIGCIGHSLGGHNTMFTAAFEPRIKVLASSCGFNRFARYYGGNLKGWTSSRYMPLISGRYGNDPAKLPFDFTEIVASFAPRPFFTNSPLHDGNFEVTGVREVIAAAQPIYALYGAADNLVAEYPESEHDFPDAVRRKAYAFFDKHLSHTPQKHVP